VELVFEGNVLESPTAEEPAVAPHPPASPASVEPSGSGDEGRGLRPLWIAGGLLALAAVVVVLLATGALGGSDSDSAAPTPLGEYRTEVDRYCGYAIPFSAPSPRQPVDGRANAYFTALSAIDDRIDRLPPPAGNQPALDQFISGLQTAAKINDEITQDPPTGRAAESAIANLTIASGKVQAGSLGFGLGPDCKAIADVIVQSAGSIAAG
jgi:hypothetical protein